MKQKNHSASAEQYYRTMVYIPFLDSLLLQFNVRFIAHRNTVFRLSGLLPRNAPNTSFEDLREAIDCYLPVLPVQVDSDLPPDVDDIEASFLRWQVRWRDVPVDDRPPDCFHSLAVCDKQFFSKHLRTASDLRYSTRFYCLSRTNFFCNEIV